jgi:hypothetical protein
MIYKMKETMSQTCMVSFASSPLRSLKEGHMQVMRTLRHWLPYHTLVDVHTNERKTLIACLLVSL